MLKVQRVLHAGYIFETSRAKIFFDPILEDPFCGNCFSFPSAALQPEKIVENFQQGEEGTLRAIVISHIHEDHFSSRSLNYFSRKIPIYLYTPQTKYILFLREMGFENITAISLGEQYDFSGLGITVIKALDEEMDSIFEINWGSLRILNLVDSWIHPDSKKYIFEKNWDLVLWPFQVFREWEVLAPDWIPRSSFEYPQELREDLRNLKFSTVIPSSCQFIQEPWWKFRDFFFSESYQTFFERLSQLGRESAFLRLDPGQTLQWSEGGWRHGESGESGVGIEWRDASGVDYQPLKGVLSQNLLGFAQTVQEISSYLPSAKAEDLEQVRKFTQQSLVRDWAEKISEPSEYFQQKDRLWRLLVWDSGELSMEIFYRLGPGGLVGPLEVSELGTLSEVDWCTEIPLVKFSLALQHRELLNSLYLQVNRKECLRLQTGSENLSEADWDVLEDPLIQILSLNDPLLYQRSILSE